MKKKTIFFKLRQHFKVGLLSLTLLSSAAVYSQDITTGLKLHYSFDNVSGTLVPDDSGSGLNGELQGAASVQSGYLGSSVLCTDKTDYVVVPNTAFQTVTDFSFTAWVKVNSLGGWSRIFDFGQNDKSAISYFTTNQGGGLPKFTIYRGNGNLGYLDIIPNTSFPVGTWVHVAITLQGGTTGNMYFNGQLVGTGTYNKNNGTLTTIGLSDLGDASTITNYIAKSHWDDAGLNGKIDDVRIYARALTAADVNTLASQATQDELTVQSQNLTLGDLTKVTSNLSLPTALGTQGVTVTWKSNYSRFITNQGVVTRGEKYDQPVVLTATLKQPGVTTDSIVKNFNGVVKANNPITGLVAEWDFSTDKISLDGDTIKVKDEAGNDYVGKLMDVARIRTIGSSTQYNVLDLGNNKGYFDMGTAIGEAVYSLKDFAVGGYYRMDDAYADNTAWGNNLFSFSNSEQVLTNPNGTMYACLGNTNYGISPGAWNSGGEQGLNPWLHPAKGTWHHFLYTQIGTVGTIYLDGQNVSTGTVGWFPFNTIYRDSLPGTRFNWIGRPPYQPSGDVYLRNTLVYGLQLFNEAISPDDVAYFNYPATINALNAAYVENPDNVSTALQTEVDNLSTLNWSNLSGTLPTKGSSDPSVSISWISNNDSIISSTGNITLPKYHSYNVKVTAVLTQGAQKLTHDFAATVPAKEGTEFASDLLVKYDFANVTNDTIVTDVAEKHFKAVLKNKAAVRTIGNATTGTFKVLALGDSLTSKGYMDMGAEVGKLIYGLSDYTIGAYYRTDADYTDISANGNFLWTFSNSSDIFADASGYMIGGLKQGANVISGSNWNGEQSAGIGATVPVGSWHHFAYTQKDAVGTLYVDGTPFIGTVNQLLSNTLVKDQRLGTLFNWIGRSCYSSDVYLRKTLVSDFRLYKKALTEDEILTTVLGVTDNIGALDAAYIANTGMGVISVKASKYNVVGSEGKITIQGLTGGEKVRLFDITGRQIKVETPSAITVTPGIYIVKVNDFVTKVIVR